MCLLIEHLTSGASPDIRLASIGCLGVLADPISVVPLRLALQSDDPRHRANAALSLAVMNDKSSVGYIIKLLDDTDIEVQLFAAMSLRHLRDMDDISFHKLFSSNSDRIMRTSKHNTWLLDDILSLLNMWSFEGDQINSSRIIQILRGKNVSDYSVSNEIPESATSKYTSNVEFKEYKNRVALINKTAQRHIRMLSLLQNQYEVRKLVEPDESDLWDSYPEDQYDPLRDEDTESLIEMGYFRPDQD